VEQRLEVWRKALEDRGMRVSRLKTEYLKMTARENDEGLIKEVKLQEKVVKLVEDFKYLGSTVQADGGSDKEVCKRIQAGWGAWRKITAIMCDKKVTDRLKGKIYKTMVRPAIMYGMETVAITRAQEEKMQVAEMKMLRWSLGLTRLDKIRNEDIRGRVKVGKLKEKIRETRMKWLGHILRREEDYVGRRVRQLEVGKRRRGRPRRSWKDCVREDLDAIGINEEDAADRIKWRNVIRMGDPT